MAGPHQPAHCRPEAFALFAAQIPDLETTPALVTAAVAISMHELRDAAPERVEGGVQRLAGLIAARVKSRQPQAVLAHAHDVFFEEEGFRGNTEDYYHPKNSYLPSVLETRRGLPISLVLVYKATLERLGLTVRGVNSPGHFLAGVEVGEGRPMMLVDPFVGGSVLSRDEAFARIESIAGAPVPHSDRLLQAATHRQWLLRMLFNLQHVFTRRGRVRDVSAMLELAALLENQSRVD